MSDSALNRWEALQRRTKADRLNAIEAFLSGTIAMGAPSACSIGVATTM
jgi:hypothetical protein